MHGGNVEAWPSMGHTRMPSPQDPDATRRTIENRLARELSDQPAPHGYATWRDYWADCLEHWRFGVGPGGVPWIAYTIHRREQLHLPAVWNWT